MRFTLAICLLAASTLMPAQTSPIKEARHALKTFTSPDGAFQFEYPDRLIVCQKKKNGDEGYIWLPAENCAAYHPVCDGLTPEKYEGVACLAYPRDRHTDTQAFEAATFSVEVVESATAQSCSQKPADEVFRRRSSIKIGGVSFAEYEFSDAGMNQGVEGKVYRTFHNGRCYQLGINQAFANAQVFDPPAREMSKQDLDAVERSMNQARDSFRILK